MICLLLRHGETEENRRGVYLGREDVSLSSEGIRQLRERQYPVVDRVFCSPLARCVQTAELIYPNALVQSIPELMERDFGRFSGLTHAEIIRLPGYSRWGIRTEEMPFPDGEGERIFRARCMRGWDSALALATEGYAAVITHGGVIMAIMDQLFPGPGFYSWQCKNGFGYLLEQQDGNWTAVPWDGEGGIL